MEEALATLAGRGVHLDTLRLRAFPFPASVAEFVRRHERVYVVEQNRDAQMRTLLMSELGLDPVADGRPQPRPVRVHRPGRRPADEGSDPAVRLEGAPAPRTLPHVALDAAGTPGIEPAGRLRFEVGSVPKAGQHRVKYTPTIRRAIPAEYSRSAGGLRAERSSPGACWST